MAEFAVCEKHPYNLLILLSVGHRVGHIGRCLDSSCVGRASRPDAALRITA